MSNIIDKTSGRGESGLSANSRAWMRFPSDEPEVALVADQPVVARVLDESFGGIGVLLEMDERNEPPSRRFGNRLSEGLSHRRHGPMEADQSRDQSHSRGDSLAYLRVTNQHIVGLEKIESIVFGALSQANIAETKRLIDEAWERKNVFWGCIFGIAISMAA